METVTIKDKYAANILKDILDSGIDNLYGKINLYWYPTDNGLELWIKDDEDKPLHVTYLVAMAFDINLPNDYATRHFAHRLSAALDYPSPFSINLEQRLWPDYDYFSMGLRRGRTVYSDQPTGATLRILITGDLQLSISEVKRQWLAHDADAYAIDELVEEQRLFHDLPLHKYVTPDWKIAVTDGYGKQQRTWIYRGNNLMYVLANTGEVIFELQRTGV